MQLRPRPRTSPEEALDRARRLVGRGAPIRTVLARRRRPDQADLFIHTAVTNQPLLLGRATAPVPMVGCGAATAPGPSIAAAVGEAIERAFGSAAMMREAIHASFAELGATALDPLSLAPFSDEQRRTPGFPFATFEPSEEIAWVRAFDLARQEPRWVPAEAVYLGAHCRSAHLVGSSSGLAAGPTLEEALVGALYELVERDAFMIAWAARRTPPEIEWASVSAASIEDLQQRAGRARIELRAFDLTTDLRIPCVLAVASGVPGETPALAVGAASRLSARAALEKALLEALHTFNWAFELVAARGELASEAAETSVAIRDFADLVYLYAHPWRARALEFLLRPRARQPLRESTASPATAADEVARIVAALEAAGCRAFAVDLSPEPDWDIRLNVVRALSPELVPLSLAGHRSYRGCRRYYTVPRRLGDPVVPQTETDLNREPHPFP